MDAFAHAYPNPFTHSHNDGDRDRHTDTVISVSDPFFDKQPPSDDTQMR